MAYFEITVAGQLLKECFPDRKIEVIPDGYWMAIASKPDIGLTVVLDTTSRNVDYIRVAIITGVADQLTYRNVSIPRDAHGLVKSAILRNRLRKAFAQVLIVGSKTLERNARFLDNLMNEMAITSFNGQESK